MSETAWMMPALMGAYHGLNPAMGWLFAVAIGLQQRSMRELIRALPPIALGHAASVSVIIAGVAGARLLIPVDLMRFAAAGLLFGFVAFLLLRPRTHPRGFGMRAGFRDLVFWSFLMSTAHGAGLMLMPLLPGIAPGSSHAGHAGHAGGTGQLTTLLVHTTAMFAVMLVAAVVVFRVLDVNFLRRAWINFDAVWIGALFVAGVVTLLMPW